MHKSRGVPITSLKFHDVFGPLTIDLALRDAEEELWDVGIELMEFGELVWRVDQHPLFELL